MGQVNMVPACIRVLDSELYGGADGLQDLGRQDPTGIRPGRDVSRVQFLSAARLGKTLNLESGCRSGSNRRQCGCGFPRQGLDDASGSRYCVRQQATGRLCIYLIKITFQGNT